MKGKRANGGRLHFRSRRSCSSLERKSKMVIKIRSRGEARDADAARRVPRRRGRRVRAVVEGEEESRAGEETPVPRDEEERTAADGRARKIE